MTTTQHFHRAHALIDIDRIGIALATLLVGTAAAGVWLAEWFMSIGFRQPESIADASAGEAAAAGGGLVILEVMAAVVLLGLIYAVRWLPEWYRQLLKRLAGGAIVLLIGGQLFAITGGSETAFYQGMAIVLGAYAIGRIMGHYGIWWIGNNAIALGLAVLLGATGGIVLPLEFIIVFLVGMTIYDHWFANKREYMFTIAAAAVRYRLPVVVLWPRQWRFDFDELLELDEDEAHGRSYAFGIGTADLLLGSMFATAVYAHWSDAFAVYAVLGGLALAGFRISQEMKTRGSGAGMPPITVGAIGAFVIAAAIGVVV